MDIQLKLPQIKCAKRNTHIEMGDALHTPGQTAGKKCCKMAVKMTKCGLNTLNSVGLLSPGINLRLLFYRWKHAPLACRRKLLVGGGEYG